MTSTNRRLTNRPFSRRNKPQPISQSRRRLFFETLEDRRVLAAYTWSDGADTLAISLGDNESLTVSESGGTVSFVLSTGTFTQSGGDAAPGDGTATITIAAADLASSVSIDNSTVTTGTNNVTFSSAGSLSSATMNVDITDTDATGTISFTGGFDITSSSSISITTNRNISVGTGSVITGGNGGITFSANQQAPPTEANFVGILINGATLNSGAGNLTVLGRSGVSELAFRYGVHVTNGGELTSGGGNVSVTGTSLATGGAAMGVRVEGASRITAGGDGTVTVVGQGGAASTDNSNFGVLVTGTDSRITSTNGSVSVTGAAGGIGTGNANVGVGIDDAAEISAGGVGSVEVIGIGGNSDVTTNSNGNIGVVVIGAGSVITSGGGSVTVTGTGGGSGAGGNRGVILSAGGIITAGGMGAVSVIGFGSTTSTGTSNNGVHLESADSAITSSGGAIFIQGTAGTGTNASGLGLFSTSSVTSVGSANITVTADSMNILDTAAINGLTNTVTLRPLTAGTQIDLGGADSASVLGLTSTELNRITAGTLVIGRNDIATGTITVNAAIAPTGTSTLSLITAANITGAGTISETNLALRAATGISLAGANAVSTLASQNSTSGTVVFNSSTNLLVSTVDSLTGAKNAGDLTLSTASGFDLTVEAGISGVQSSNGTLALQAGQDLLLGTVSNFGDARGSGLTLSAGRDIIVVNNTFVQADGASGVNATAGRDITIQGDSLINSNAGSAPVSLTTGVGGILTIDNPNGTSGSGTNGGPITVTADDVALTSGSLGTTGTVTVRPVSVGREIDLGTNTAGTLGLTNAELNRITAGTIQIGDSDSGDLTLSAPIVYLPGSNFQLVSGGSVIFDPGSINTGGGNLSIAPASAGSFSPKTSGVEVVVGADATLSFASGTQIDIRIDGPIPDTQLRQLNVQGKIDLTGTTLMLSGDYVPTYLERLVFVQNDDTDPIIGTFQGLPQGQTVNVNGVAKKLSYVSGDGNDVALIVAADTVCNGIDDDEDGYADEDYVSLVLPTRYSACVAGAEIWIPRADWGDAPTAAQSGFANNYPTTEADDGAAHLAVGPMLGGQRQVELDGQPTADADGDFGDDGITFNTPLSPGTVASITVQASEAGKLDAWIDFDQNGSWDDPDEQIFGTEALTAGDNLLTFQVPAGASLGQTYARFRISTAGNLASTGVAEDGEVEDYAVALVQTGTISISPLTKVYDGTPFSLSGTIDDGPGGLDPDSVSTRFAFTFFAGSGLTGGIIAAPTAAGNYSVEVSYSGSEHYAPVASAAFDLTVTRAPLTVTADAKSKVYGSADPPLTYTATGLVPGDAITGSLTREPGEDVGSYAIQQGTLDAGANYSLTYEGADLTVTATSTTTGSGNVSARPHKRNLVVTGDNAANSIRIVPGTSPGEWVVIGIGDTKVNGKPQDTITGVTQDVLVDMRGGDDYVLLEDATVARDVKLNMGAGSSLAVLVSVSTGRHVTILAGRGGQVDAHVVTSTVGGNLHVCGGTGSESVVVTDTTVQGNLTARLGGGADELQIRGGEVGRDLVVNSSTGNDTIGIQGLDVQRDMRIDPCSGDDGVTISDIDVGRHATIRLDRGLNTVEIDRLQVFARFALTGGRHADRVLVGTEGTGGLTSDSANFSMGSGDDTLVLLDSIFRDLAVNMGTGSTEFYLEVNEVNRKTTLRASRGYHKITEEFGDKNILAALNARGFDEVLAAWD
ncbi:MAG: hypothetical protein KJ000_26010 [Pirellulaceae bacterium]|nr:hypothetical protein [Pirellulaceae bacterium]